MNKVDDFLEKLTAASPKSKEDFKSKNRSLEKIYLNYPGNFGRYQVLPMDNVITDFPFSTLFNTREINIPRKNISADGTENVYNAWIKLLPKSAYIMKDMTGRQVSSLTAADDQLLNQAYMLFDQLYDELDVRNNRNDAAVIGLARKRNYTVFHGMCLNKWDADSRVPSRQNFCGLFVCTAKGFTTAIEDNIQEKSCMEGNTDWIASIYNRQLTDRDGYLLFSIAQNKLQAGYVVTATHEVGRAKNLEGISIPEEDAELMVDPVETFLGWQANRDDNNPVGQKRLFNAKLIQEAITFMGEQLAAIRMAKSTGLSMADAIARTNEEALKNQVPTNSMGQKTNDPMLAQMAAASNAVNINQQSVTNPGNVTQNNNNPYVTPPAAHIDPVTNAPVSNGGFGFGQAAQQAAAPQQSKQTSPFEKPTFAQNFGGKNNGGEIPF